MKMRYEIRDGLICLYVGENAVFRLEREEVLDFIKGIEETLHEALDEVEDATR